MTVLQGLVRYYERLEKTGLVAPRGYSEENISFAIVLTRNGDVVDVYDLRDHASRKPRPRSLRVPAPPADRSGKKRVSAFLWDNSKYALGVGRNRTELVLTPDQFEEFRCFHLEFLKSADDLELTALRSFVASWDPEKYKPLLYSDEIPETKIVFRLEENTHYIHESQEGSVSGSKSSNIRNRISSQTCVW